MFYLKQLKNSNIISIIGKPKINDIINIKNDFKKLKLIFSTKKEFSLHNIFLVLLLFHKTDSYIYYMNYLKTFDLFKSNHIYSNNELDNIFNLMQTRDEIKVISNNIVIDDYNIYTNWIKSIKNLDNEYTIEVKINALLYFVMSSSNDIIKPF